MAAAMATAQPQPGTDARWWDDTAYRRRIPAGARLLLPHPLPRRVVLSRQAPQPAQLACQFATSALPPALIGYPALSISPASPLPQRLHTRPNPLPSHARLPPPTLRPHASPPPAKSKNCEEMAAAMATAQPQPGTDARWWDDAAYRRRILREQDFSCRTLFRVGSSSPSSASTSAACICCCNLLPFLLLPLPLSLSASVVTRLPGFDGPLPFYLETGYMDVEEETGTELFYYFVESERSPGTDAVLLWLTGGPRCSAFSGLAFEVGPIKFVLAPYDGSLPQLVYNPISWTQMASIIFLDSPVGSGFSYARDPKGYDVGDYSSSLQVLTFLKKWFHDHPQYLSNPFYIGGDSYAGKVIPLIAQNMSEGIEKRQQPLINLKGYLVGNPITDSKFDDNSKIPCSHGFGIISDQIYEAAVENCKGDYVNPANEMCAEVLHTINNLISEIATGHILYDKCVVAAPKPVDDVSRRKNLLEEPIQLNEPPGRPTIGCFTYGYYLSYFWMNDNMTRDALRIKEGTVGEWIRCIKGLPYARELQSSIKYHFNLTTRGYRALVFSGDHDLQVPFLGTQAWIRSLNFSIVDDWRAWHLDGQAAGFTITYANNLTFATIKGGGHTAPEYRPEECFAMAQRWLDNKPL